MVKTEAKFIFLGLAIYAMSSVLFEALVAIILLIYWHKDNAIFGGTVDKSIPRAAPHYPLIGSFALVAGNSDGILDTIWQTVKMYDFRPVLITLPFSHPTILTNDPTNIEHVLKTNFENYVKGAMIHSRLGDVLGRGIFVVDGNDWKVLRKTASNIFNTKSFRSFVETVFADKMSILKQKLKSIGTESFDLQDLFFRYTLDSFAYIGFGAQINSLEKGRIPFADSFDRLQRLMDQRFNDPFWRISELWPSVRLQYLKDIREIKNFGSSILREHNRDSSIGRMDLLSLFMEAKNANGEPYKDQELIEHVLNFIIAGRDTTAQALSWTIYHLCANQSAMKKLLKEIDSSLGGQELPTYDQVRNMKYANAVFHEALRLNPSVPKNIKIAINDDILPDGTKVRAGNCIGYSAYILARRTDIWGSDAHEFKPERWLNSSNPSQFDYLVFNAGPRVCLGKSFAELEGVFVLVSLLKTFHITIMDQQRVTYGNSLTLPIKDGLQCRIALRSQ